MGEDLYSAWLKLPPGARPPDHYALLGLPRFCDDIGQIEAAAHQRLDVLDRYALHIGAGPGDTGPQAAGARRSPAAGRAGSARTVATGSAICALGRAGAGRTERTGAAAARAADRAE